MKKIYNKKLELLIFVISSIVLYLLYYFDLSKKMVDNQILNSNPIILLSIFFIVYVFSFSFVFLKTKFNKIQLDKVFIILALVFGSLYLILSPLFTGSDEQNHYYRIYEISEGQFITPVQDNGTVGSVLPKSLYQTFTNGKTDITDKNTKIKYSDEMSMSSVNLNPNETMQYGFNSASQYSNTALYNPLQYLPQVLGFFIGRILNLNPLVIGYIGRIFNLVVYIAIGSYFIKKLPRLKLMAITILLSPILLSSATTLSADAFTNILIFALFSMIINTKYSKEMISKKDKLIFFILSILISSCKIVYFPLIFLILLINNDKFKNKKDKLAFFSLCMFTSLVFCLLWLSVTKPYFSNFYTNSNIQKQNILSNLLWYFVVIIRTYFNYFGYYLMDIFCGSNMYHYQLHVYSFISIAYLCLFFSAILYKSKDEINLVIKKWKRYEKILISIISIIVLVLITTAIYIQCTANFVALNNSIVEGLQGRYFIPLFLLFLLSDITSISNIKVKKTDWYFVIYILLQLSMFLEMIVCFSI